MYDYMGSGMGGYMWIFWIIPVGLLIWAVIMVLDSKKEQTKSPLEILQERYAKGEIDKQEFEEKQRDLQV